MQAKTHDFGPIFVQRLSLKRGSSLIHRAPTNETEPPFRTANSYIIRVPGTKFGMVIGLWKETGRDEDQALLDALAGNWLDIPMWTLTDTNSKKIEALVRKYADTDEERKVLEDMLGLHDNASATLPAYPQNYIWNPKEGLQETPKVVDG